MFLGHSDTSSLPHPYCAAETDAVSEDGSKINQDQPMILYAESYHKEFTFHFCNDFVQKLLFPELGKQSECDSRC